MKKIASILLILFIFSVTGFARPVKRIKFAKGATKVTVTGYLNGYKDSQIYLVRLRKGQTLTTDSPNFITVFISDPRGGDSTDMDASCNKNKIVEQTKAGDYKITVTQCQKADAWKGKFRLNLTVK